MKGLDLRKFKKLHANEDSTTLKHPDGHEIRISHRGIKEPMRKQLDSLPKFSDGGMVDSIVNSVKKKTKELMSDAQPAERPTPVKEPDKKKASNFMAGFGYAQGGTVVEDPDAELEAQNTLTGALSANLDNPFPGVKPNGDVQYQELYKRTYDEQKLNNPGMPDSEHQRIALATALELKNSQASSQAKGIQSQQSRLQDSAINTQQQNAQRAQLGLEPLPMPQGAQMPSAAPAAGGPNVQLPEMPAAQGQTGSQMPMGMDGIQKGASMQLAGIDKQTAAIAGQAQAQATAAEEQQAELETEQEIFEQEHGKIVTEIDAVTKDYMEGHIEPNRFFDSKSNLGKASTAIGLLLGGIGGALTGQENPALKFLNQQIDRDIESQKLNMSKQGNLIKVLHDKLGNLKDATNMAKAMYMGIYAAKIEKTALDFKDPMAAAIAMQSKGVIYSEMGKLTADIGKSQTQSTLAKLSNEGKQRYDNANMGMKAISDMTAALSKGDNTFSVVGDNHFTEARQRFVEAIGRMQSGGMIGKEEGDAFRRMAPTATDSRAIQQLKLRNMMQEMQSRMQTLGVPAGPESNFTKRGK